MRGKKKSKYMRFNLKGSEVSISKANLFRANMINFADIKPFDLENLKNATIALNEINRKSYLEFNEIQFLTGTNASGKKAVNVAPKEWGNAVIVGESKSYKADI